MDTGADVSVFPPSPAEKRHRASLILQAVNQSTISTYGEKSITLDIAVRTDGYSSLLTSQRLFLVLIFLATTDSRLMFVIAPSSILLPASVFVVSLLQHSHQALCFASQLQHHTARCSRDFRISPVPPTTNQQSSIQSLITFAQLAHQFSVVHDA